MDQPPLLKTRRSNAVHSRRLAVHVSLLERHLAGLEADRARAVRALQDELRHLHVLRRPVPPLSPRRREAVHLGGSVDRNSQEKTRQSLPPLGRPAAAENQALVLLHPAQKPWLPSATRKGLLPPVTVTRDSLSNDDSSVIKQFCEDASKLPDSSSSRSEACSRPNLAESRSSLAGRMQDDAGPESEQHAAAHGRKSDTSDASDPVGVHFKARANPRESRSLPPVSHNNLPSQGHDHRQRASKKEGGVSKGNLSGAQSNGKMENSYSLEGPDESKSADPAVKETTRHQDNTTSGKPESRIRRIQNEAKESRFSSEAKVSRSSREPNAQPTSTDRQPRNEPANRIKPSSAQRPPRRSEYDSRSLDVALVGHHRHSFARGHNNKCHLALARSDRCDHFPCTRPPTYHSLGFHPDRSTHPWPLWLLQNARRPHHRLPGAPGPTARDTRWEGEGVEVRQAAGDPDPGSGPDPDIGMVRGRRRLGKEEVVRLDMARKKRLHALHRPPSWNTNYGRPTPYKRLNCQVRLKSLL